MTDRHTKTYNAHGVPLFCSLDLKFMDIHVLVVTLAAFLRSFEASPLTSAHKINQLIKKYSHPLYIHDQCVSLLCLWGRVVSKLTLTKIMTKLK